MAGILVLLSTWQQHFSALGSSTSQYLAALLSAGERMFQVGRYPTHIGVRLLSLELLLHALATVAILAALPRRILSTCA